ncbi:MAG: hypothetical protein KGD63_13745 [Candidatus Lokiarchaeota archaeon]|nr:hypothetical protein [Candidatus Lokiarchaeota archaeon]
MPCNHGLDEINCPICRIANHTTPKNLIRENKIRINPLKQENQIFKDNISEKILFNERLSRNHSLSELKIIKPIKTAPFLNEIPDFKNKMFMKRLQEIDLKNPDKFGISNKNSLESPEWKFNLKKVADQDNNIDDQ